jgi:hypothetical protein
MNKNFVSLIIAGYFILTSCGKGASFEKEVRSLAELRCKEMQLMSKKHRRIGTNRPEGYTTANKR